MAAFVRRFRQLPPVEVIRQIESVNIVDIAPPPPATGVGTGAVLLVGEFEDGLFATDAASNGSVEVFGSQDYVSQFGGFGFTYSGVIAQNPCSRIHMSEFWNGNGYIKSFGLAAQRLMVSRVDTSVGTVAFQFLAAIAGGGTGGQTFALNAGDTLKVTTNIGAATSAAITGAKAVKAGAAAAFGTILSGDAITIAVDGGAPITVTFGAADTSQAAVIARINGTMGSTVAVANTTQVDLQGVKLGTSGNVTVANVTTGALAKIGQTAGTVNGTGTFGNLAQVQASELATFINGDTSMGTNQVKASVLSDGTLRIYNSVAASVSTILVPSASNNIGNTVGFAPLDTTVAATGNPGGKIPAGTRVATAGGTQWVVMQTTVVAAGAVGPISVKVRPAQDDGTNTGTALNTVTTLVDQLSFAPATVNNPSALTAALNENQLDNAYINALNATLNPQGAATDANYLLMARRSDPLVVAGVANANSASNNGLRGRKFISGDPLGTSTNTILANVAKYRDDRLFYTGKALRVRVPAIAQLGVAGGTGFTADGVISVRPDGPLATICASRPPEENPGQQTNLIDQFFAVDSGGETLTMQTYTAYRAGGVAVPRIDRVAATIFQSGVTSSLSPGLTTMARRKMADFLGDTISDLCLPYAKKLSTQARRDSLRSLIEGFCSGLQSAARPDAARIAAFSVDDSVNAGNTPASLALGIYYICITVQTLSSLDFIVATVNAGENAIVVTVK